MKKCFTFLLTFLLSVSLCACGRSKEDATGSQTESNRNDTVTGDEAATGSSQNHSGTTGDSVPGSNSDQNTPNNGDTNIVRGTENAVGRIGRDLANAGDALVGDTSRRLGVPYDQMVQNARVRDTDGDLKDHENVSTGVSSLR